MGYPSSGHGLGEATQGPLMSSPEKAFACAVLDMLKRPPKLLILWSTIPEKQPFWSREYDL